MTEEKYLQKLVDSYEELILLQREKINNLEKELEGLKKTKPIGYPEDPFKDRYSWKKEDVDDKFSYATAYETKSSDAIVKPEFGSMSSKTKKETLQDYINRGGVTELKKTVTIPTPLIPTTKDSAKKGTSVSLKKEEKRPRIVKRHIFFKSFNDAQSFADRYSEDFGLGKVKKTVRRASETHYEIKKNTIENTLFTKGYGYVLIFSMNGLDFSAIEDLEKLEKYYSSEMRCVRLFNEKKAV